LVLIQAYGRTSVLVFWNCSRQNAWKHIESNYLLLVMRSTERPHLIRVSDLSQKKMCWTANILFFNILFHLLLIESWILPESISNKSSRKQAAVKLV